MRRLISYLIVVILMMATIQPAWAVDKKKKEEPKKTTVEVKKKQAEKIKAPVISATKGLSKKFDKFVDKNKNGIDDRRENLRTKKIAPKQSNTKADVKKKTDPAKSSKKASKKDSTKTKK